MTSNAARSRRFATGTNPVIVLGAAMVLSLCGLTGYEIMRQHDAAVDSAAQDIAVISEITSGELRRMVAGAAQVMAQTAEVATDPALAAQARPGGRLFRDDMRDRATGVPQLAGLAVLDRDGKILNTLHDPKGGDHRALLERAFVFHRDHLTLGPHFGTLEQAPLDGSPIIPLSQRLSDGDGDFAGIVFAAISLNDIAEVLRGASSLPGGAAMLALADGPVLAAIPADPADLAADPAAPTTGVLRQGQRLLMHRQLHPYPLRLTIAQDLHTILAPWRRHALRLGFGAALASGLLIVSIGVLLRGQRRDSFRLRHLQEQEAQLRMAQFALDTCADLVIWHDDQGRVVHANQAAVLRLGYSREELLALSLADIDPSRSHGDWPGVLAELHKAGQWRFEAEWHGKDGIALPVDVAMSPFTQEGRLYGCAVARDIVERKRTERVLLERTARLEASNAELEQFAYVASHDLREPLRTVNSFVTMLARRYDDRLDDEAREYIAFAQEGALRMDRLIQDLLEYSRVGRIERSMVPVALAQPLDLALKSLGPAITAVDARITPMTVLPAVVGNEAELVRLFVNLIGNALKYHHTDRAPMIDIGTTTHGDTVTVTVTDNGIGIAPEYFDRVFRVFQRLHSHDQYEGTGIGLAICKKIVERHGGRIWLSSVPELGTTVFFTLPLAPHY